jgi:Flp pilus assembly protein TadD
LDKVIADETEAIRLKPGYAEAHAVRGAARGTNGELDEAIADETEAIRLDPNYGEAYFDRGLAFSKKGEGTKAELDFERAKELADPSKSMAK